MTQAVAIARPADPPALADPLRLTPVEWTARFAALGVSTVPAGGERPGLVTGGAVPLPIAISWSPAEGSDAPAADTAGQPVTLEQFLASAGRTAPVFGTPVPLPTPIEVTSGDRGAVAGGTPVPLPTPIEISGGDRGVADNHAVPLPGATDAAVAPSFEGAFSVMAARLAASLDHLGPISILWI